MYNDTRTWEYKKSKKFVKILTCKCRKNSGKTQERKEIREDSTNMGHQGSEYIEPELGPEPELGTEPEVEPEAEPEPQPEVRRKQK